MTIRVEGLNERVKGFKQAGGDMNDLKDAFQRIGLEVVKVAKSDAPVLSGRLQRNIKAARRQNKVVITSGGTSYHLYQHFGTKYMRANPYMFEAVEKKEDWVENQIETEVDKVLRDI